MTMQYHNHTANGIAEQLIVSWGNIILFVDSSDTGFVFTELIIVDYGMKYAQPALFRCNGKDETM